MNELKGKKTWAKSPIICRGRLESFQMREITEILRDYYCIDTTYWPNALNFNTAEPFVCKSRGHKTKAAVPSCHRTGECQLPEMSHFMVREKLRF